MTRSRWQAASILALAVAAVIAACTAPLVEPTATAPSGPAGTTSPGPTATLSPAPPLETSSPTPTLAPAPSSGTDIGERAPEFTLTTTAGAGLSLSELRGRPVWIVFWAPGCPSCAVEMGMMETMYREHRSSDLEIVGIAVSTRAADAEAFGQAVGITYPLAVDTSDQASSAVDYQVYVLPTHYFIDRDGIVRGWAAGDAPPDAFEERLARIIGPAE
jgi:peroxiredoxin